jgi:hypothetical protein
MRKLAAVLGLTLAVALTGCTAPKTVSTKTSGKPVTSATTDADNGNGDGGGGGDDNTTQIGKWASASDGIKLRVSKIARGRISDIAAGGHPGDPAVIAYVQIRNGSSKRFDLTMVEVAARVGADGNEAEQVFQDGFGDGFNGALTPGRTVTAKYMFAAKKAPDLKKVSIEVTPGLEYESATFEGGL